CVAHGERHLGQGEERRTRKYPKLVAKWVDKSYALLEFLNDSKGIRVYLYTTNQLERLIEVRRNTVEKLPCP
ncbi:transposase, partial [Candidatus Bipolaricaulota bacterium]|nr:transposase [Candidatus Bipolaricaulota bacterium]